MDEGIFLLKNYGKVSVNIKEVMDKKKITRNKLANLTGATYNVINRYYNNELYRIDLDVLARICYVLDCDVTDVIKYEKWEE